MTISTQQARALFERAASLYGDLLETIKEIIATEAWLALDPPRASFSEAWEAYLTNIPCPPEVKIVVIYQMAEDGLSSEQIADSVHGVREGTVDAVKRQKDNGVPADQASLAGGHREGGGRRRSHVYVDLGVQRYAQLADVAARYAVSVEDCVVEAVDEYLVRYGAAAAMSA
jgi:hypothetical protein